MTIQNQINYNRIAEAIEYIKKQVKEKGWQGKYLKGELSQTLMSKYDLPAMEKPKETPTNDEDFINSIKNIATGDKRMEDFTFMEVFKAESIIEKDEVINILKKNELLYPVSFVVRKQDTVLKNLINLRLLEMRSLKEGETKSELETLIKEVATSEAVQIPEERFENIFIQSYQFEATPAS